MVVSFLLRYTKGLSWDFVPRAIHKGDNQRLFTWTWTSEKGGEVLDWKKDVERLHFDEGKSITEITGLLAKKIPATGWSNRREKVWGYIRRHPRRKVQATADHQKGSLEYKSDGTIISEKFIVVRDGDEMTPGFILNAHGLKSSAWEVVSYKNNFWNTQIKGGAKQISYQSKLTAKPTSNKLDLAEIDKHFAKLDRKYFTPPQVKPRIGNLMAEVNVADLHLAKLCCKGDTPENYDYKIARDSYYRIIGEIVAEIKDKPIEHITFVWANDFFNSDTIENTTTAGTRQDTDVRWTKMFDVGVEMLVRGIEMLSEVAQVKTFYTPSNHDEVNGYHALKYLEAWFRKDSNVHIDTSAFPRKYQLYGNTLLGYCHGDKENARGTREKASRLASLMPIEAKELWGQASYHEMHTAHLHSEQMIQEINGVIVRRISSPTALDSWHTKNGYVGAVRKAQTFLYDKARGLVQTINTPVEAIP